MELLPVAGIVASLLNVNGTVTVFSVALLSSTFMTTEPALSDTVVAFDPDALPSVKLTFGGSSSSVIASV